MPIMKRVCAVVVICLAVAGCEADNSGPGSEAALRDQRWREFISDALGTPVVSRRVDATLCENMRLISEGHEPTAKHPILELQVIEGDQDWPSRGVARDFVRNLCS
jgi:hypothetical protein